MSTENNDETVKTDSDEATSDLQHDVIEIKEAVDEVMDEQKLTDKVEGLRLSLDNLSGDVENWKTKQKNDLLGSLESIKSQVEEIEQEWDSVSKSMKAQRERLESLLEAFPSVIETSTIRALTLRLNHLENLVANLTEEHDKKLTVKRFQWQLVISIIALSVTIFFWAMFATGRLSW
ncbi:MAG: hypothetical protein R6T78_03150 [Dehalococcoidales bacterium]